MQRKIDVQELKPGMIPASDVLAGNGRLLVNSGIALSGQHIRALKTWGIREIVVNEPGHFQNTQQTAIDTAQEKEVYQDPELLDLASKKIMPFLVHADLEHPAMQELFRLAQIRLAREMARNPDMRVASGPRTQTRRHGEILFGKQEPKAVNLDPDSLDFESLEFPPLPELSLKLQESMLDPECTAAGLAEIINLKPELSKRLLNVVNSSFYGLPFKVESIFQALTLLGTKQVTMMALSVLFKSILQRLKPREMNMNRFWRHSMACAIAARSIGSFKGGMNIERLFLAGMLHDIGKVILMQNFPQQMNLAHKKTEQGKNLSYLAEYEALGVDHARIGGLLLSRWKFSLILEHTVSYHHFPGHSMHLPETAVVHIADIAVHTFLLGQEGFGYVPPMDSNAWEVLGLDPAIFASCLQQVDRFLHKSSKT